MKTSKTPVLLTILLILSAALLAIIIMRSMPVKYEIYGGLTAELKNSELYEDMQSGKTFCFLGDSITAGTEVNGIPWYQPLIPYIHGRIMNISCGGWTTSDLIDYGDNIPSADIYVIAIGINDALFLDNGKGAGSPENFISNLEELASIIRAVSPEAKMYFITPWPFINFPDHINEYRIEFSDALCAWCDGTDRIVIDPYPVIMEVLYSEGTSKYMLNDFHPNTPDGIGLFSYAVLQQEHLRRTGN
jgi:lysophospholipase L1-like esterase